MLFGTTMLPHRTLALATSISTAAVVAACASDVEPSAPQVARTTQAVEASNALTSNALVSNALISNALVSNALVSNALVSNALVSNALVSNALVSNALSADGVHTEGELARQALQYVYSCAMPAGASMALEIDGTIYSFQGAIGLAPEWAEGACGETCQRWVSACLMARVNALGTPVQISIRGPHPSLAAPSVAERAAFPLQEGAFYGNLFGDTPIMNTCNGTDVNYVDLTLRKCTGSWEGCPFTVLGPCAGGTYVLFTGTLITLAPLCSYEDADGAWRDCSSDGTTSGAPWPEVITVYLTNSYYCGDGVCELGFESCGTCAADCGACAVCGNGACEAPKESHGSCPADCAPPSVCGNGVCESGYETCATCPADCPKPAGMFSICLPPVKPPVLCGNGVCEDTETCACAADCNSCPNMCQNGICEAGETPDNCLADCPVVCGDGVCSATEDCGWCAADCGACPAVCGNGGCEPGEDCGSCSSDCGECVKSGDGESDLKMIEAGGVTLEGKKCLATAEACNGKDDDCDGLVDEDFPLLGTPCDGADADVCAEGVWVCGAGGDGVVCSDASGDDVEVCNGVDDDCDGATDEGVTSVFYADEDGDGYGTSAKTIAACAAPAGWVAVAGDCNDGKASIRPGAAEVCNGVDDNCNGSVDEGVCGFTETFDGALSGWSLGSGWNVASWCGFAGKGLGFGNGSSYPNSGSAGSSAKRSIAIPATGGKLVFRYRYSPDPKEYGSYDRFTVAFGGATLVNLTAGTKGDGTWKVVEYPIPSSLWGTTQTFSVTFTTIDSGYNYGWGAAVDEIALVP